MHRFKKPLLGCVSIAFAFALVGCETVMIDSNGNKRKKKDASWFSFKKKEYQIPQSMTVTWSHDILTLPGKAPTRGFGGRFYFYNEKTQAIPVEGDLVVYGFDDTHKQKSTEDLNLATKRFRFTAEQLTTHFTEGELGASYSVWIPWDEAYGPAKKIMLIPTFLAKDGKMVRGTAASLNLPGSGEDTNEGVIQQMSAMIPVSAPNPKIDLRGAPAANPESGLRTTTIQVPTSSLMHGVGGAPTASNGATGGQNDAWQMPQSSNTIQASYTQAASFVPNSNIHETHLNNAPTANVSGVNDAAASSAMAATAGLATASFGPPKAMTLPKMSTKHVNGWVTPEYSPMDVSSLAPRSAPNQFQAQASPNAPSWPYPTK